MTVKELFEAVNNKTLRKNLLDAYDAEFAAAYNPISDSQALYSGFSWINSKKGYDYWFQFYDVLVKLATFDKAYPVFMAARGRAVAVVDKDARIKQLESAIRKTIRENRHLADSNNCTLIHLKNVLKKPKSNK